MNDKWYSNSLNDRDIGELVKVYAKIANAYHTDVKSSVLKLDLMLETRGMTSTYIKSAEDISTLLEKTKASEVSDLKGKVIESYWALNGNLKGISINKNLI